MRKQKILSVLLSICMVASSLFAGPTDNGSVYKVSAAYVNDDAAIVSLDFEDAEVGVLPTGWVEAEDSSLAAAEGKASMLVVADGNDNKAVKVTHTNGRSKNYSMSYSFDGTKKAELEYRFKAETATGSVYMPVLAYDVGGGTKAPAPLCILLSGGTKLQYSSARDY